MRKKARIVSPMIVSSKPAGAGVTHVTSLSLGAFAGWDDRGRGIMRGNVESLVLKVSRSSGPRLGHHLIDGFG
jgi:hypothetical protein